MTPGERAEASRRITENRYRRALSRVMGDIRRAARGLTDPDAIVQAVQAYANTKAFGDLVDLSVQRMITAQKVAMRAYLFLTCMYNCAITKFENIITQCSNVISIVTGQDHAFALVSLLFEDFVNILHAVLIQ